MNRDLFLAVLAMDSYNRGYNPGIDGLSSGIGAQIGTAVIVSSSDNPILDPNGEGQAASFYAVAYQMMGETIISYRGTDALADAGADFTIGGTGNPNSPQAYLAADFYSSVVGAGNQYSADATLVGHSLGGGLAGLIAGIYGKEAAIFDNMAFRNAANAAHDFSSVYRNNPGNIPPDAMVFNPQALEQGFYGNIAINDVNFGNIHGWQTAGQFLAFQSEGTVLGADLGLGGTLGAFDLHSMSLLVVLMYASDSSNVGSQDWRGIALPLITQLYSAEIAEAAGITQSGTSEIAEAMRTMIAYSVVDEGPINARPFGDAAIRAMFDDANDIAPLFGDDSTSLLAESTDVKEGSQTSLSKIVVQHAAQLAKGAAMMEAGKDKSIVITLEATEENENSYVAISVDKASAAWAGATSIVGFDDLKTNVTDLLLTSQTEIEDDAQAILDGVEFVVFAQTGAVNATEVKDAFDAGYHLSDAEQASALVIGTTESDHLTGTANDDFLVGGKGTDTLIGGDGKDALFGGDDADVLVLGKIDGQNAAFENTELELVDGGSGSDYLVITGAEGDKIKVGEGDTDDRLLIHAELLGLPAGSDGKIPLFALLGGLSEDVKYSDSYDGSNPYTLEALDPDYYLITDPVTGEKYRRYDYYGNPNSNDIIPFGIEYHKYENSARLEILIFADPDSLEATQTIVIDNFSDGDYGIHLMGPYYPTIMVPSDEIGSPWEGPGFITDEGQLNALNAAATVTSKNAMAYSLSTETGGISQNSMMQGSMMSSSMFSTLATESITAENLMIAIDGGAEDDRLEGNDVAELISGGDGNDRLFGAGGDDRISGDAGNDRMEGGAGSDVLDGGDGNDIADYAGSLVGVIVDLSLGTGLGGDAEGDTLISIEYAFGSALADHLIGDGNINRLVGNDGNDVLDGAAGNDTLIGGLGADIFIGGAGDRDVADYRDATEGVALNLVTGGTGGEATGDTFTDVEYVYGSSYSDGITGNGSINRIVAGAGDDTLDGAGGNDYLLGEAGNDVMTGGAGADVFVFDAFSGQDTITDFWAGPTRTDRIQFIAGQFIEFSDVIASSIDSAAGVVITIDGEDSITLAGLQISQLHADDFLFA